MIKNAISHTSRSVLLRTFSTTTVAKFSTSLSLQKVINVNPNARNKSGTNSNDNNDSTNRHKPFSNCNKNNSNKSSSRIESSIKQHNGNAFNTVPPASTPTTPATTSSLEKKIQLNNLSDILVQMIKTTGPLSLSGYMKTCLTHPEFGYYTTRDPLGLKSAGDFVTSPEISQMFGEMIGVWFFTIYLTQNQPQNLQFIEFGPGKGTLMYDTLRSFNRLLKDPKVKEATNVILVEASPLLRQQQFELLCGAQSELKESADGIGYAGKTIWGNTIRWVDTEKDIDLLGHSDKTNFIVCHEFFDALPIKQFEKTDEGWRECLVDYAVPGSESAAKKAPDSKFSLPNQAVIKSSDLDKQQKDNDIKFHVTIAPKKTTASYLPKNSPRHDSLPVGLRVEISPETLSYAKKIQEIITSNTQSTGAALLIDYGPADTIPINTFRGIKNHKIVSPFENPGTVDLSADVDFQGIKLLMENVSLVAANEAVDVHGPVEQGDWLNELGMAYRAEQLFQIAKNDEQRENIKKSYLRLVEKGGSGMGKIYKFMGVVPKGTAQPVGFGGAIEG